MKAQQTNDYTARAATLYPLIYGVLSLLFLERFPFVHSDECWLFGLTRDMRTHRSLAVTESFFNAKVRYPHAIKSFYHLLQMAFTAVFGDTVFAVRLLSLVCAVLFLYLFYALLKELTGDNRLSCFVMVFFSVSTWFLYLSHFARQEIFILLLLAAALYAWIKESGLTPARRAVCSALFTGIAIGFHPNSFLIAASLFFVILSSKEGVLRPLLSYTAVTALFAAAFISISYRFGPDFLPNYFSYGASDFGLDAPPGTRLQELFTFFARLWMRQSGTYYLPDSRPAFLLGGIAFLAAAFLAVKKKDALSVRILAGLAGLTCGTFVIGRYNPLGFLFFWFFAALALGRCLVFVTGKKRSVPCAVLCVTALLSGIVQIAPWIGASPYRHYLNSLAAFVPANEKTLANLNTGFYFEQGKLLDLRNLPYVVLDGDGATGEEARYENLEAYLTENEITHVVYSSELDYLYAHRPYYNVIYGNTVFVPALKRFCETRCETVGSFSDAVYGARVMNIFGQEDCTQVTVYRIKTTPAD